MSCVDRSYDIIVRLDSVCNEVTKTSPMIPWAKSCRISHFKCTVQLDARYAIHLPPSWTCSCVTCPFPTPFAVCAMSIGLQCSSLVCPSYREYGGMLIAPRSNDCVCFYAASRVSVSTLSPGCQRKAVVPVRSRAGPCRSQGSLRLGHLPCAVRSVGLPDHLHTN